MEADLLNRLKAIGADFPKAKPNNPPTIRCGGDSGHHCREARWAWWWKSLRSAESLTAVTGTDLPGSKE